MVINFVFVCWFLAFFLFLLGALSPYFMKLAQAPVAWVPAGLAFVALAHLLGWSITR